MKKRMYLIAIIIFIFLLNIVNAQDKNYSYRFIENEQGVELRENNNPVFFFQRAQKSKDDKLARNDYIHPLYNLAGNIITQDFPKDHPHHRGIFWAWHQILIDTLHISDSWALKNFSADIKEVITTTNKDTAFIKAKTYYKSPIYNNSKPYLEEQLKIKVYRPQNDIRIIDFTIKLTAMENNLYLGGSDNEKGYGGFSIRIKMPDSLKFLSENGYVKPQKLQLKAGPWMDFTAPFDDNKSYSGVTLICSRKNPNYPQPWILRQKSSMQNVVWPGKNATKITMEKAIELKYRLLIHNGKIDKNIIEKYNSSF